MSYNEAEAVIHAEYSHPRNADTFQRYIEHQILIVSIWKYSPDYLSLAQLQFNVFHLETKYKTKNFQ